jgi:hypothetical protein
MPPLTEILIATFRTSSSLFIALFIEDVKEHYWDVAQEALLGE